MTVSPYKIVIALLLAVSLSGCGGSGVTELRQADYYFGQGMKDLERGRCTEAIEHLQRVVSNFPGSTIVAEAQFHLAEAHFCTKDYVTAGFEYQRVLDVYPSSEWVERAQFNLGECYFKQLRRPELDQKETFEALTYFRQFIEDNPSSSLVQQAGQRVRDCRGRLAKKEFLNGDLYFKQGFVESAELTFKQVLRNFSDTPVWYYSALARLGDIAFERDDHKLARSYWDVAISSGEVDENLQARLRKKIEQLTDPKPSQGS